MAVVVLNGLSDIKKMGPLFLQLLQFIPVGDWHITIDHIAGNVSCHVVGILCEEKERSIGQF